MDPLLVGAPPFESAGIVTGPEMTSIMILPSALLAEPDWRRRSFSQTFTGFKAATFSKATSKPWSIAISSAFDRRRFFHIFRSAQLDRIGRTEIRR